MKTLHRNYSEAGGDFDRLARYFISPNATARAHSTWCLGRLVDWKYGLYDNKRAYPAFCDQNAHLWFDGYGELAGFAISESGDTGFHILTLKGYRFLYEEMLAWVLDAWKERMPEKGTRFSTEITEFQQWEASVLESQGFCCKSTYFTRRFDLTIWNPPQAMPFQWQW